MEPSVRFEIRSTAFENRLLDFGIVNLTHIDILSFLNDSGVIFINKIDDLLSEFHIIKVNACFKAEFIKTTPSGDEIKEILYIQTISEKIDIDTDVTMWYTINIINHILVKCEDFEIEGSGWTLSEIKEIEFHINKSDVFIGSSFIDLPLKIKKQNAIINVRNYDNQCFKWAVLSALHSNVLNPNFTSSYSSFSDELNFTNIEFPVNIRSVKRFEQLNPTISVNVYHEEDNEIAPLRLTKNVKHHHIHLLLLHKVENDYVDENNIRQLKINSHYCYIKDLSRLVRSQVTAHKAKIHICDRCLNYFTTNEKLQKHLTECINSNDCKITLPKPGEEFITYKNIKNQLEAPYVIYADIESILEKVNNSTNIYQNHKPFSIGYYLKCRFDDNQSYYKHNRDPDCIKWFIQELHSIAISIGKISDKIILNNIYDKKKFCRKNFR